MNGDGKPVRKKGASLAARNKKIALDYVDALRRKDRAAVNAALSPNFRFARLNDHLARFEYLDSVERTIFATDKPQLDVLFVAADGDRVSMELALEFYFNGRRLRGQYHSLYVIEDGEIYEIREYGGIPD